MGGGGGGIRSEGDGGMWERSERGVFVCVFVCVCGGGGRISDRIGAVAAHHFRGRAVVNTQPRESGGFRVRDLRGIGVPGDDPEHEGPWAAAVTDPGSRDRPRIPRPVVWSEARMFRDKPLG